MVHAIDIEAQNKISEERVHREGHSVDPSSRLPIEYRTLSIHVDTSTPSEKGRAGERRRIAVKGSSIVIPRTIC